MQFGANIGRDHFLRASCTDQQVELEPRGSSADHREVLHLAADKRTDDRHRMIHSAEAAYDDDVTIFDETGGLVFIHQHFLALGSVGAGNRFELHGVSSRNTGVSCSDASAVTWLPIAGGKAPWKWPSTRLPLASSTSSNTNGAIAACALSGTRMTVWLCTVPCMAVIATPLGCARSQLQLCRRHCG